MVIYNDELVYSVPHSCCKSEEPSAHSMKLKPKPNNVQVCECVVILKNLKDVSWAGAKSMMADTGFLKGLVEFDKDSLSDKQVPSTPLQHICLWPQRAGTRHACAAHSST